MGMVHRSLGCIVSDITIWSRTWIRNYTHANNRVEPFMWNNLSMLQGNIACDPVFSFDKLLLKAKHDLSDPSPISMKYFSPKASCWFWTWRRHQMETFSSLLAIRAGNSSVTGLFPAQRPVTRSFDVFFGLRLNKRLSKQWSGWWFETPSPHYDVTAVGMVNTLSRPY